MDADDPLIPPGPARDDARLARRVSAALIDRWHGTANDRLRYAYAPRFVLSCTDELLREVGAQAKARGVRIHTHASENRGEVALVRERFGKDNIVVLDELGLLGPHIVHRALRSTSPTEERALLAARGAHVCTCPSSNLKLAIGHRAGAGADRRGHHGRARRRRRAVQQQPRRLRRSCASLALLHKPRVGPRALPAPEVRADRDARRRRGARAQADQIGSLELGKRGDVIAVDVTPLHTVPDDESVVADRLRREVVRRAATWPSTAPSSCAIGRS